MQKHEFPVLEDVRQAAVRPFARSGWRFWALAGFLALLVAWAGIAFVVQYLEGLGAAGYSDRGFWGIYEANLVAFIAVSYGGALVSAILRLTGAKWRGSISRLAESMAVFSLLVGMGFALIHVGRPERLWLMITRPQISSPIFWDLIVISTYMVATLIFCYLPLIADLAILRDRYAGTGDWRWKIWNVLSLRWQNRPGQRRLVERGLLTVAILIIPLAVFVHSVLSWAFSLTGRPGWDSTIFAPYFVVGALFSGVAMVILVVAGFNKAYGLHKYITIKHFRYLAYLMLTLDLMYLYFTFSELMTEGYIMHEEVVPVLESLVAGQYAPLFWLFIIGGCLVPLLMVAFKQTRTVAGITVAAALVVSGMWLKRMLIVVPAVAHPLIAGDWGAFRMTWIAVGITVGAAAAIPLMLMLFFKVFPILAIDEMEELAAEAKHEAVARPAVGLVEGGMAR